MLEGTKLGVPWMIGT